MLFIAADAIIADAIIADAVIAIRSLNAVGYSIVSLICRV